ncbi:MAG: hypothetical protein Q7V48_08020 [Deltaproteobacteria bacterium]|nr:hypothetical protein [Deltaproteobacteria bacterium]
MNLLCLTGPGREGDERGSTGGKKICCEPVLAFRQGRRERKLSWVDDYGKELVTEFYSISRRIPWKECCLIRPSQGLSPHGPAYRLE